MKKENIRLENKSKASTKSHKDSKRVIMTGIVKIAID